MVDLFESYDDARTCEHQIHELKYSVCLLGMVKYQVNFNAALLYAQEICSHMVRIPKHFLTERTFFSPKCSILSQWQV